MSPTPRNCCAIWPPRKRGTRDRSLAGSYLAVQPVCGRHRAIDLVLPPQSRFFAVLAVVHRLGEIPGAVRGPGGVGGISFPPVSRALAILHPVDSAGGGKTVGACP